MRNTMVAEDQTLHSSRPAKLRSVHLFLLCLLAGCGSLELQSHWRDHEVVIDGKNTEWYGFSVVLDKERVSASLLNDEDYLYIGLVVTDRGLQRQIMRQGITFWFDRNGSDDKKFGIRFPLGFSRPGFSRDKMGERGGSDQQRENVSDGSSELEIYRLGGEQHQRMTMAQASGIEARFHTLHDTLMYELKVPLADNASHPFAIDTTPGSVIGVGVESSHDFEKPPEGTVEGEGGRGGFGGRGGGGRRNGFGGGEPGSSGSPEPLKVWAKVQLAVKDSSSQ